MRKKLISYVDNLFSHAPKNAQSREIHDEILLNTLDRYDEELCCGRSEQDAYDAAVESIGDIGEVLEPLYPAKVGMTIRRVVAIALYICCVIPVIVGAAFGELGSIIGTCLMFCLIAFATYLLLTSNLTPKTRRLKQLRASGIALYILCVTPTILFSEVIGGEVGNVLGVALMFLIAAAATALVIYPSGKYKKAAGAADQKASADQKSPAAPTESAPSSSSIGWKIFVPIYWVSVSALFCLLGLTVLQWYYAWLVFPIAGALFGIISGIAAEHRDRLAAKKIASSVLWLLITLVYLLITIKTEAFHITWLCFPIGSALNGILSGIIELKNKGETKK